MRELHGHFVLVLSKSALLILLLLQSPTPAAPRVFYKEVFVRKCDPPFTHCVSLRECAYLQNKINSFVDGLSALQVIEDNVCSLNKNVVKVCCRITKSSVLQSAAVTKRVFQQTVHDLYTRKKHLVNEDICGRILDNKVFIGESEDTAQFKDFPWMAALLYKNGPAELKSMCGGTLISNQYVLTAAHCADERMYKLSKVRFGFQKENCGNFCMDYEIGIKTLHEDFDPKTLDNDIALLFLERPVKEFGKVVPICLPIPELMANKGKLTKNNIFTTVRYEYKSADNSAVPTKTHVVLENDAYCSSTKHAMPNGQKCAKSKGICQGDSGSALVYPVRAAGKRSNVKIFQMGIISSGYSDCAPDTPIRMISVNYYLVWILEKIVG